MSCNCKGDNSALKSQDNKGTNILNKIGIGLILFILTPLIVVLTWWFGFQLIANNEMPSIRKIIDRFRKGDDYEEDESEFNTKGYVLEDVDIIK